MNSHSTADDSTIPAATSWLTLGVSRLEHSVAGQMQPGHLYSLVTELPSIRYPLLNNTIAEAIRAGVPCTIIEAARPEHYLERLCTPPKFDLNDALDRRMLNVYCMQSEFQKKMFQVGVGPMLEELDRFGVEYGSLVLFDHASSLLNLYDLNLATQQLDAIGEWGERNGLTVIMVFSQLHGSKWVTPRALLDSMSGMATLSESSDGLAIGFPYWQFNGGVASGVSFRIELNAEGDYEVTSWKRTPRDAEGPYPETNGMVLPANPTIENQVVNIREFETRNSPRPSPTPGVFRNLKARRSEFDDFL
ncbi:BcsE family c-di-GMP-binding protein [Luteimonas sp. FXH3W]|uniref:BcsE family c-di-GMP-binding protein n=1 Tax=Aquilutibacter rugosus TaxID=3115820 RepID=A0ABU7UZD9_9GAMM